MANVTVLQVAKSGYTSGITSQTTNLTGVQASSYLILCYLNPSGGTPLSGVSATGYTWSLIAGSYHSGDEGIAFWLGTPGSGSGGSVSVTASDASSDGWSQVVYEIGNFGSIAQNSLTAEVPTSGSSSVESAPSLTPAATGSATIQICSTNGSQPIAITTGQSAWTEENDGGGNIYSDTAYQTGLSAGTGYSCSFTTSGSATQWILGSIVIAPASPYDTAGVPLTELPPPVNEFPPIGPPAVTKALLGPGPQPATTYQAGSNLQDPQRLAASWIIPGYQYPTLGIWNQPPISNGPPAGSPGYIIANPNSGPGTTVDSNYAAAINLAVANGWTVLGYVDTNYNAVTQSTLQTNVGLWNSLYGVTNIFFDRANNAATAASLIYCQAATALARQFGGISIMNMGTAPLSTLYFNKVYCDGIIVFESSQATFQSSPPPNYSQYAVGGFYIGHIVYGVSTDQASSQISQSAALGANMFIVTDEPDGNYDLLPSYAVGENLVYQGYPTYSTSVGAPAGTPPVVLPFPPIGPPPVIAALFGPGVQHYDNGSFISSLSAQITPSLAVAGTAAPSGSTVQITAALTPSVAVAAADTETVALTAAIAPTLAVAAADSYTIPITAAIAPSLAVADSTDTESVALTAALTPGLAIAATNAESVALTATSTPTLAVAATGPTTLLGLSSALTPNLAVATTNAEAVAVTGTSTPTLAVAATNAEMVALTAAIAPSLAVAATGPATQLALSASTTPGLAVATTNAEAASLTAALTPNLALAASESGGSGLSTSIAPSLTVSAADSISVVETVALTPSLAVAASNAETASITASLTPGLAVTAANAEAGALSSAPAPALAIATTDTKAVALTAALAPGLAVAASNAEAVALTGTSTPSLALAATQTTAIAATAALGPFLAVQALNGGASPLTTAITPSLAVTAGNAEIVQLTAAITPGLAVAATNKETVALSAAPAPALALATTNAEAASLSAALTPTLSVTAANGESFPISAQITPSAAVSTTNAEEVALTAAPTPTLAISTATQTKISVSSSLTPNLAITAAIQSLGLITFITATVGPVLSISGTSFDWYYVGHESASTAVQPAMDFNQQSATLTVQPALY